ncbi:MAG: peroxide stress protein YaaA [Phycisphaerales bacterium]|nr:peroxide stress protein YaaA [Phycisphaerales bacterium]
MSTMMAILSPAKSMHMGSTDVPVPTSRPRFSASTKELAETLRTFSTKKLGALMSISDNLSTLNASRWEAFGNRNNERGPAAICFSGDVYQGFEASTLDKKGLAWAQTHIRILSGLYGLLRPLDVIQPYRLEMGTALKTSHGKNLYEFWGSSITKVLKKDISSSKAHTLVNLASDEYSKAVDLKNLGISVVGVKFLQRDGGREKFVSFFAKQARGLMARWMSECRPKTANDLKKFNVDGYKINTSTSSSDMLIFSRPKPRPKKS